MNDPTPNPRFPKARFSASANASQTAELERLRAMTVEERMRMALALGKTMSGLSPQKRGTE